MNNFEKLMHDLCQSESSIQRWICTYEQKSVLGNIIRNIPPTLAIVSVDDNTRNIIKGIISETDVRAYSSKGFSVKITENGKVKSIGIDSKSGQVLNFFETKQDCKNCYNSLLIKYIMDIESEKQNVLSGIERRLRELNQQLKIGCY